MSRRAPPPLYAGGLPSAVMASVVSAEDDPPAKGETIATIAADLDLPYDHVKRAVVGLRRRDFIHPSRGYAKPLSATAEGRQAILAHIERNRGSG